MIELATEARDQAAAIISHHNSAPYLAEPALDYWFDRGRRAQAVIESLADHAIT
jgi:hypothetical protein